MQQQRTQTKTSSTCANENQQQQRPRTDPNASIVPCTRELQYHAKCRASKNCVALGGRTADVRLGPRCASQTSYERLLFSAPLFNKGKDGKIPLINHSLVTTVMS
jgi:hypothetical protein